VSKIPRIELSTQDHLIPLRLNYDFEIRLGLAYVAVGVVPERDTMVALFRRLDAGVRQVQIVAGDQKTLVYLLRDGVWFTVPLT